MALSTASIERLQRTAILRLFFLLYIHLDKTMHVITELSSMILSHTWLQG